MEYIARPDQGLIKHLLGVAEKMCGLTDNDVFAEDT